MSSKTSGESSIAIASGTPALGNTLTFNTVIGEKLAGWEYPMVDLLAFQDVNQDGTTDITLPSGDIVFSQLDHPNASFLLGGYDSIWKQRGGGAANCTARLCAYGWKGGKQSVRILAAIFFTAEG